MSDSCHHKSIHTSLSVRFVPPMCVCMYVCMYDDLFVRASMHYILIHTHIHAYTHTLIHSYRHTHTLIHSYTHTLIHSHTHTDNVKIEKYLLKLRRPIIESGLIVLLVYTKAGGTYNACPNSLSVMTILPI